MPRQPVPSAPIPEAEFLWALGRYKEAEAADPWLCWPDEERELAIWAEHAEAITREWERDYPGTKPPILLRIEAAEAEREERRRWCETYGHRTDEELVQLVREREQQKKDGGR